MIEKGKAMDDSDSRGITGMWRESGYIWHNDKPERLMQCSQCGIRIIASEASSFCPMCGADMDNRQDLAEEYNSIDYSL